MKRDSEVYEDDSLNPWTLTRVGSRQGSTNLLVKDGTVRDFPPVLFILGRTLSYTHPSETVFSEQRERGEEGRNPTEPQTSLPNP